MAAPRGLASALVVVGAALALGLGLAAVILALAGVDPLATLGRAVAYGLEPTTLVAVANKAIPYALAGFAAAIGFHLRLFNIGIDGQYRLAAFAAAVVGAAVALPAALQLVLVVGVALAVGAAWAAIAGWLQVRRGVNVVISTIMLNQVATGLIAWLLGTGRFGVIAPGSNNLTTPPLAVSAWVPGLPTPAGDLNALAILVVVAAVGYWFVMARTTVGFEIRAIGLAGQAARVAGMRTPRLTFGVMLASGAMAGVVGLPQLLGATHHYGLEFPAGLGFTGLSVAILGRNHPIGVIVAAFAWAFVERSAQVLDLAGVSREVVAIVQAVIVLGVVVSAELVARRSARRARSAVAHAEGAPA